MSSTILRLHPKSASFLAIDRRHLSGENLRRLGPAALSAWIDLGRRATFGQAVRYGRRDLERSAGISARRACEGLNRLRDLGLIRRVNKSHYEVVEPLWYRGQRGFIQLRHDILDGAAWAALSCNYRTLLLWIWGRYDGQGIVQRLGRRAVARETGLSEDVVRSGLAQLVRTGFLRRHHGGALAGKGAVARPDCYMLTFVDQRRGCQVTHRAQHDWVDFGRVRERGIAEPGAGDSGTLVAEKAHDVRKKAGDCGTPSLRRAPSASHRGGSIHRAFSPMRKVAGHAAVEASPCTGRTVGYQPSTEVRPGTGVTTVGSLTAALLEQIAQARRHDPELFGEQPPARRTA